MRLAFSIPVHERADAVLDSIRNIQHFNPGAVIVLHVSRSARDPESFEACRSERVLINDRRLATGQTSGLFLCHSENFRHLQAQGVPFDTFCITSSNELFLRPGLADYAAEVRNAFQAVRSRPEEDWHIFRKGEKHPKVAELLRACGGTAIYGGQTEGQFYEAGLFGEMCALYRSVFGEQELWDFETEELVPQTIAMARGVQPHLPYTLVDYSTMGFELNRRAVAFLADPGQVGLIRLNLGLKKPEYLRNPHQDGLNEHVYAVKRVPRDPAHPLRRAVRALESGPPGFRVDHPRREVPLVSRGSYFRLRSDFIRFCGLLGIDLRLTVGVRTLFRRWFKRRAR